MSFTIGSLFDGSGGFPLAAFMCGGEPVWASEVEPYPIAVTKSRFPYMEHLGDISKINGAKVKPVDVISFGSPCQDLSVAGLRKGLKHEDNGDDETTRSGLFMEAVRIIKEMREATNGAYPRVALWENVPGAFSSNKGEDFRVVLEELIKIVEPTAVVPTVPKAGWPYADCYRGDGWSISYRVLDAQFWGVPQRRRRIYLVLDLRGERAEEILFKRESLRGYFAEGGTPWQDTAAYAERGVGTDDYEGAVPYTLKIRSGCEGGGKGALVQEDKNATLATNNDQYLFQPVAYSFDSLASNSMKSKNPHSGCRQVEIAKTLDTTDPNPCKNQGGIAIVEPIAVATQQGGAEISENGICPTITAAAGMSGNNQPWICEVAGFKAGNGAKANGIGWQVEVSPTLSAAPSGTNQAPTVCVKTWDARGNGDGDTVSTLTGDHENRITDYTSMVVEEAPVYCLQGNGIDRADTAGCNGRGWNDEVCYTLNTIDRPAVAYAIGNGQLNQISMAEQANTLDCMHDKQAVLIEENPIVLDCAFCNQGQNAQYDPQFYTDGTVPTLVAKGPSAVAHKTENRYIVRRLTPTECARLQGFPDKWGHPDVKDALTDEEYAFWLEVRNTHAAINGKTTKEYTKQQMLTWYNKLHTDSAEYKMWGNGIALPTALYVMQSIAEVFA